VLLKTQVFRNATLCCWASTSKCFRILVPPSSGSSIRLLDHERSGITRPKIQRHIPEDLNLQAYADEYLLARHSEAFRRTWFHTVGHAAVVVRVAGLSAGAWRPVQGHNTSSRSLGWPIVTCVRYVESDGMTNKWFLPSSVLWCRTDFIYIPKISRRTIQVFRICHWLIQQSLQIKCTCAYTVYNYAYRQSEK
jgi:hypothetical protein